MADTTREVRKSRFNWPRGIGAMLVFVAGYGVLSGTATASTVIAAIIGTGLLVVGMLRR